MAAAVGVAALWSLGSLGFLGGSLALATRAPAPSTVTVPTATEGWYHAPDGAAAAGGLGLPTPMPAASPYPEGTLHVGVKAGAEESRTYASFDTASLIGRDISAATLVLPVDTESGTAAPEVARLDICFAPDPGPDADGSFAPSPEADCTLSVSAHYEAEPTPRFVADITALADEGLRSGGLAVVPSGAARAGSATWHVAFYGRERAPDPELAIHAEVETASAVPPAGSTVGGGSPAPAPAPSTEERDERPGFAAIADTALGAGMPEPAPVPGLGDGSGVAIPNVQPVAAEASGFAYPAVLALPLAMIALAGVLGSSLIRDPRVQIVPDVVAPDDASGTGW